MNSPSCDLIKSLSSPAVLPKIIDPLAKCSFLTGKPLR